MKDLAADDAQWKTTPLFSGADPSYKGQVTQNRKLVGRVEPGSICVIPRPGEGVVHLCKVNRFELVDNPAWADAYLELRAQQRLDCSNVQSHIGDVVQSWEIDGELRTVPFTFLPRWITYRLLSRNSCGVIPDRPYNNRSAYEALLALYNDGAPRFELPPTLDPLEVEGRLMDWVSPSAFEHLVVELLQLRDGSGIRWWHVGGSGDGGSDGLATDSTGVVAALQCKWMYNDDPVALGEALLKQMAGTAKGVRAVVAVLFGPTPSKTVPGVEILTRADIARLLVEHHARCGSAVSLGIG